MNLRPSCSPATPKRLRAGGGGADKSDKVQLLLGQLRPWAVGWGGRGGLESGRCILSQETGNIRPQALTQTGPGLNSRTEPVICPCDAKAPLRHPAPSPSSPWEEPPPRGAWQSWPRSANAFRRQAAARGGLPTARRRRRKSVGSGPGGSFLSLTWGYRALGCAPFRAPRACPSPLESWE